MKKTVLSLAVASTLILSACNQGTDAPAADPGIALDGSNLVLDTEAKKLSYGVAQSLGQQMKVSGMPFDAEAFVVSLQDVMAERESRLSPEEFQVAMESFQARAEQEMSQQREEIGGANLAAGEAFLAQNKTREGVMETDSGLQYEVVTAGEGPKPGPDDTVEVHYRGTLVDGTQFDSSYDRGQTATFGVGQVIPGWTEALQLMSEGSTWKLAIPSDLAYGSAGAGQQIGPNSVLLFDVELIAITPAETAEAPTE